MSDEKKNLQQTVHALAEAFVDSVLTAIRSARLEDLREPTPDWHFSVKGFGWEVSDTESAQAIARLLYGGKYTPPIVYTMMADKKSQKRAGKEKVSRDVSKHAAFDLFYGKPSRLARRRP